MKMFGGLVRSQDSCVDLPFGVTHGATDPFGVAQRDACEVTQRSHEPLEHCPDDFREVFNVCGKTPLDSSARTVTEPVNPAGDSREYSVEEGVEDTEVEAAEPGDHAEERSKTWTAEETDDQGTM